MQITSRKSEIWKWDFDIESLPFFSSFFSFSFAWQAAFECGEVLFSELRFIFMVSKEEKRNAIHLKLLRTTQNREICGIFRKKIRHSKKKNETASSLPWKYLPSHESEKGDFRAPQNRSNIKMEWLIRGPVLVFPGHSRVNSNNFEGGHHRLNHSILCNNYAEICFFFARSSVQESHEGDIDLTRNQ